MLLLVLLLMLLLVWLLLLMLVWLLLLMLVLLLAVIVVVAADTDTAGACNTFLELSSASMGGVRREREKAKGGRESKRGESAERVRGKGVRRGLFLLFRFCTFCSCLFI